MKKTISLNERSISISFRLIIIIAFLLPLFLANSLLGSDFLVKTPVKTTQVPPRPLKNIQDAEPVPSFTQSPGLVLDSTYYDWQRNGGYDDHLAMYDDGGAVHIKAVMTISHDQTSTDRCLKCFLWNGTQWVSDCLYTQRTGLGSMSLLEDGKLVACTSVDLDGGGTRAYSVIEGGLWGFQYFGTSPDTVGLLPRISANLDGS